MLRTQTRIASLFMLGATSIGAIAPVTTPAQAASRISARTSHSFVLSTGNVYFTSNEGPTASLWRIGQSARPGQETRVYTEANARFGQMTIALVGDAWFAYFFVTRLGPFPQTTAIKRVALSGGPVKTIRTTVQAVMSTSPNLVTDGTYVYWQDRNAVRKVPICSDPVVDPTVGNRNLAPNLPTCADSDIVVEATGDNPSPAGLALRGKNLIYADGTDIRFVPTTDNVITAPLVRTIAKGSGRVTALHVVSNGVYWGEAGGAVRLRVGSTTTTLPSTLGLVPVSIATNGFTAGAAQVWAQCAEFPAQACRLHFDLIGGRWSTAVGLGARVGVTSAGTVFWSDAFGIFRQPF
jgi:hypothetical protein